MRCKLTHTLQTIENFAWLSFNCETLYFTNQALIPDAYSSQRPATFHGFDSEDFKRWLDKKDNCLKLLKINNRPTTLAELTLNRTGLLLFFWIVESLYSYLNNFVLLRCI